MGDQKGERANKWFWGLAGLGMTLIFIDSIFALVGHWFLYFSPTTIFVLLAAIVFLIYIVASGATLRSPWYDWEFEEGANPDGYEDDDAEDGDES